MENRIPVKKKKKFKNSFVFTKAQRKFLQTITKIPFRISSYSLLRSIKTFSSSSNKRLACKKKQMPKFYSKANFLKFLNSFYAIYFIN